MTEKSPSEIEQKPKRIDSQYVLREIGGILSIEKGFFWTVKELVIRPEGMIKQYLFEDRKKAMRPLFFLIICSLIYSFTEGNLSIEGSYIGFQTSEDKPSRHIGIWIQEHYGYANLILGMFMSTWLYLLFRKHRYKYFEHMVIIIYLMGIGMLIFALSILTGWLIKDAWTQYIGFFGFLHTAWAIGRIFSNGQKRFIPTMKGFFSYMLGMISFGLSLAALGVIVDRIF